MLELAAGQDEKEAKEYRRKVGQGVQEALKEQFRKYDLTGKTWATLTRSTDEPAGQAAAPEEGPHWSDFGAQRYQQLVPSLPSCSRSSWRWWSAGCS